MTKPLKISRFANIFNLNMILMYDDDDDDDDYAFKAMKSLKNKQIDSLKQPIVDILKAQHGFVDKIKAFVDDQTVLSSYDTTLLNTLSSSMRNKLAKMKSTDKAIENEQLFIPTLGSQEGKSLERQTQHDGVLLSQ